jgi:transaldolase
VKQNVTALMTLERVQEVTQALVDGPPAYVSVFAGRVADTGRDPLPMMAASVKVLAAHPHLQLIWASPRELLNLVQANQIGCHVITVTYDLLKKLHLLGKDLEVFSLETVTMFRDDAVASGFQFSPPSTPQQPESAWLKRSLTPSPISPCEPFHGIAE